MRIRRLLASVLLPAACVSASIGISPAASFAAVRVGTSIGTAACGAPPSGSIFVSQSGGNDGNSGTQSSPFKTIERALRKAETMAAPTVVMMGNITSDTVYRTGRLRQSNLDSGWDRPNLSIINYPGHRVWFDGSTPVSPTASGSRFTFSVPFVLQPYTGPALWNDYALPTQTPISDPAAGLVEQVWADGVELRQVAYASQVTAGSRTFFAARTATSTSYTLGLTGTNVYVSKNPNLISLLDGADNSKICGVGVRRYADDEKGAIHVNGASGVTLRELTVTQNALRGIGISAPDANFSLDGIQASPADSANITLRNLTVSDNGMLGINAIWANGLRIFASRVKNNNVRGFAMNQSAGGIKIHSSRNVEVADNVIESNNGNGLWFDLAPRSVSILRNDVYNNARNGIEFETGAYAVIAGNVIYANRDTGLHLLESNDVDVWNNTFAANQRFNMDVMEGMRHPGQKTYCDDRYGCVADNPFVVTDISVHNNLSFGAGIAPLKVVSPGQNKELTDYRYRASHDGFWRASATSQRALHLLPVKQPDGSTPAKEYCGISNNRSGSSCSLLNSLNPALESSGLDLIGGSNTLAANPSGFDFRLPAGSPAIGEGRSILLNTNTAMPLTDSELATQLGVSTGTRLDMGALRGRA